MDIQPEVGCAQRWHVVDDGHKRRQADRLGRDAEQQVHHRRVAGDRDLGDLLGPRTGLLTGRFHQLVDGTRYQVLHFRQVVVLAGVDDARDDILAARNLAVVVRRLCYDLAAEQVDEPHRHGRGADVDSRAVVHSGLIAGQKRKHTRRAGLVPGVQRHHGSHLPLRLAQGAAERADDR
jgi:hypothetical protein